MPHDGRRGVSRRGGGAAVPSDLGPELEEEKRCDLRPPAPCRPRDQGDAPQHLRPAPAAQTPSPHRTGPPPRSPQPPARSTERLDPRRHRHRRPRGLARRPPRVATRGGEGKEKVAARARVSPRCRPRATRERGGGQLCDHDYRYEVSGVHMPSMGLLGPTAFVCTWRTG